MVAHKRINILFVHANNYDIGGSDYCLLKLAAILSCSRFNPLVLLGMKTEIADKYREYGIPLMIMPMYRIRKIKKPWYQLKFFLNFLPTVLKIVSLIKRYRIDIVHSNDFLDIYGPIAARLAGVKSIQHDRLIMRRPSWLKELFCFIIKTLNHRIAVVSDGVGREMFSRKGMVHPKVITCYDWIDMEMVGHNEGSSEFRREIGVSEEHVLIGAVGRLEPLKGQHVFIKAAAQVVNKFPYARFVIVGGRVYGRGREKYEEELQYLSSELRLDERIIFAGYRKDISNVVSALDISVLCSVEPDSLPGVVMEAMEMCKPVIGPRAGGVPEQIVDGTTGLLYEPGSHQSMAKAICRLIDEPELAKAFGAAGKQRAKNVFNKEVLRWHMENVYEDMLND
jgi:glycosyltransferase involved in cell wall biosynthesis